MLKKISLTLLLIIFVINSSFAAADLKAKYKDAPMTIALCEYLIKTSDQNAYKIGKELTKIVKQYVSVGTPIEDALSIFAKNHFKCNGAYKHPQITEFVGEFDSDKVYVCSIENVLEKRIFRTSRLGVHIDATQGKVVNLGAFYHVYFWGE